MYFSQFKKILNFEKITYVTIVLAQSSPNQNKIVNSALLVR